MTETYFPQGIATDRAFCNRDEERKRLAVSIAAHEHTVLVAPRRYGKTSLIAQVLKENDFYAANIDFFFVLSQLDVTKQITEGVTKIINQLLPKTKSACQKIIDSVKKLNPKLTFNVLGQKIELVIKAGDEKNISEVLLALDYVAQKTNNTCVVVLDEFQQIGELKENHAVEAAIRHAVERSNNVSYIFCGSKRHLLNEMFSNRSRPLYHLCDLMQIDRISSSCYEKFLTQQSHLKWGCYITKDAVDEILFLTKNHPYYVNALCRRLWKNDKVPSLGEIRSVWDEYILQQSAWITNDFAALSLNRKKVIKALVFFPTDMPQGEMFVGVTGLTPSNINRSLSDLLKMDFVYRDLKGFYRVLDPAMAYYLAMYGATE